MHRPIQLFLACIMLSKKVRRKGQYRELRPREGSGFPRFEGKEFENLAEGKESMK